MLSCFRNRRLSRMRSWYLTVSCFSAVLFHTCHRPRGSSFCSVNFHDVKTSSEILEALLIPHKIPFFICIRNKSYGYCFQFSWQIIWKNGIVLQWLCNYGNKVKADEMLTLFILKYEMWFSVLHSKSLLAISSEDSLTAKISNIKMDIFKRLALLIDNLVYTASNLSLSSRLRVKETDDAHKVCELESSLPRGAEI